MPHWDQDSPELLSNLDEAQRAAAGHAVARREITLATIRSWHRTTMRGLSLSDAESAELVAAGIDPAKVFGQFRGPPHMPRLGAGIGGRPGARSDDVARQCADFVATLRRALQQLDRLWPRERLDDLDADGRLAAAEVAAWAHGEWIRTHPFANGNGRTARLLANAVLVRYGLPPVMRPRPRPSGGNYAAAGIASMEGDHGPIASFVLDALNRWTPP